jgi:hypothetical protein
MRCRLVNNLASSFLHAFHRIGVGRDSDIYRGSKAFRNCTSFEEINFQIGDSIRSSLTSKRASVFARTSSSVAPGMSSRRVSVPSMRSTSKTAWHVSINSNKPRIRI